MTFGPPPPHSAWTHSAMTEVSRKKQKRFRFIGIIVAMAVIIAASVAGVWFTLSRADDEAKGGPGSAPVRQLPGDVREGVERAPEDPAGYTYQWHNQDEKHGGEPFVSKPGTWLTEKYFARGRTKGPKAYIEGYHLKPKSDEPAWKIQLPGGICGKTENVTVDGRTALLVGAEDDRGNRGCGKIVVVDLNRGKLLWSKVLPVIADPAINTTSVTISQDTAAVSWLAGSAAYDLDSGKKLWADTQASKCTDRSYAGGRQLLAVVGCGAPGSDSPDLTVAKVDPRTGRHIWTYSPGKFGHKAIHIVSTAPVVLAVYTTIDASISNVLTLDDKGKLQATIPLNSELIEASCGGDGVSLGVVDFCSGIVASNKYVFIRSKSEMTFDRPYNNVAAYDVKTGKGAGRFDGTYSGGLIPFQRNGDNVLAVQTGGEFETYVLYELQVTGEKKKPFLFFKPYETIEQLGYEFEYRGDTFVYANPGAADGDDLEGMIGPSSALQPKKP